jgi:ABC-type multidrug transport system fused ATPase/permease subunit
MWTRPWSSAQRRGLPEGYATLCGERGIRLSGGQRQRIGIARALYKRATFLVLDEATSALDTKTERDVIAAIGELSSTITVVMVAHRLSTLADWDRIARLHAGKIAEIEVRGHARAEPTGTSAGGLEPRRVPV